MKVFIGSSLAAIFLLTAGQAALVGKECPPSLRPHPNPKILAVGRPLDGMTPVETRDEGIACFQNDRLTAARIALTRYVEQIDVDANALTYLGLSQCDSGDYAAGLQSIKRAIKADANFAHAYMALASRLPLEQKEARYKAATQALALLKDPKTAEDYWYRSRAKYFIDSITLSNPEEWTKRGDVDRRKFIEMEANPETYLQYWRLGTAYQALGERPQCITAFTQALKISQEDYAYNSLHQAQAEVGDTQGALQSIDSAIYLNPRAEYLVARGNLQRQLQHYDKAIADFDRAQCISQSAEISRETSKGRAAARFCRHDYAGAAWDACAANFESLKLVAEKLCNYKLL